MIRISKKGKKNRPQERKGGIAGGTSLHLGGGKKSLRERVF